jgi:hypothetical protein
MEKRKLLIQFIFIFFIGWIFPSCVKENAPYITPVEQDVHVNISFMHLFDGEPLKFDTLIYETSIGNRYMVTDLQYFISCVRLHQAGGKWIDINTDHEVHYIDGRVPETWSWILKKSAPEGAMDSISFVFGMDSENNYSYRFPDPPERDMFWPEVLGGGYHYMKMNLKWKNPSMNDLMPFMFHLGIGQIYKGNSINPDSIIGYVPNYFIVRLPFFHSLKNGEVFNMWGIIMNIEKWFDGASAFDFADYPKGIMQNQEGMFEATRNGRNAFDFEIAIDNDK